MSFLQSDHEGREELAAEEGHHVHRLEQGRGEVSHQVAGLSQPRVPRRPEEVRLAAAGRNRRNHRDRNRIRPALPGEQFK